MALMSVATLQSIMGKLGLYWDRTQSSIGTGVGAPTAGGNIRATANNIQAVILGLADFEQLTDMLSAANSVLSKSTAEAFYTVVKPIVDALGSHFSLRGKEVSAAIVDLPSFLTYYNGGAGGLVFSSTLVPEATLLYTSLYPGQTLPAAGVMSPALQPDINPVYTNGMGASTYLNAFTAGSAVNQALYSAVNLVCEVTTTFTGGTPAPSISVAGVDHTGSGSTVWTATIGGNGGVNPTGALSGVTITPAIVADTNLSVLCSSSVGIVPGSVLTINKNKPDQELVIVTAIADPTHFTAAFHVAHAGGATVDGWNSTTLVSAPASRRCVSVTGITITIHGHGAGVVRLNGVQDGSAI